MEQSVQQQLLRASALHIQAKVIITSFLYFHLPLGYLNIFLKKKPTYCWFLYIFSVCSQQQQQQQQEQH